MKLSKTEMVLGAAALLIIGNAIYKRNKNVMPVAVVNLPKTTTNNIVQHDADNQKRKIELIGIMADLNGKIEGYIATTETMPDLKTKLNSYLIEFNRLNA